jgi:hypothetical protein
MAYYGDMEGYPNKPGQCNRLEPKQTENGFDEEHSCPCGGTIKVCKNCGGDYHEDLKESENCFLHK